jgi:hypothetical protein
MDEIPYGKYVDSNINHDLPLSTEIVPYKAIKIDEQNIEHREIYVIDHTIQHAIVHRATQRYTNRNVTQIDFIHCNFNLNYIKWFVISSFTISILFVFIGQFF